MSDKPQKKIDWEEGLPPFADDFVVRKYRRLFSAELLTAINLSFPAGAEDHWYVTVNAASVDIYRSATKKHLYRIVLKRGEEVTSTELQVSKTAFGPLTRWLVPHKSIVNIVLANL